TTFALTVFADLTVAVEIGMILAALLYIRRVSNTTTVARVTQDYVDEGHVHTLQGKDIPDDVTIFRIHGPFLFGSTEQLAAAMDSVDTLTRVVIFRLRNMTAIDATGLRALQDAVERLHRDGRTVIVCGARDQPRAVMQQAGFIDDLGAENVCANIDEALARAKRSREFPAAV
ncbi:MAG TPA: STAS domain-containing protein, partial [Vicinamibacterales bacterium]|nr:STAS domain-containing protein [Vicinamibacterales bacterium]